MVRDEGLPMEGEKAKPYQIYRILGDGTLTLVAAFDSEEELKAHPKRPDWRVRIRINGKWMDRKRRESER